jgi:hypothetical protein
LNQAGDFSPLGSSPLPDLRFAESTQPGKRKEAPYESIDSTKKKNAGISYRINLVCASPAAQALLPPPSPDGGNANGNTAEGTQALFSNTTGNANTAIGVGALYENTTGTGNTATGMAAMGSNTTGFANTAIGAKALLSATGNYNVALGDSAGESLTTGNNNVDIGYNVLGVKGESNTVRIGNTDIRATYISGISGRTVVQGATLFVDSNGKLGTMTASTRFSDEIKPMDKASEAILTLSR